MEEYGCKRDDSLRITNNFYILSHVENNIKVRQIIENNLSCRYFNIDYFKELRAIEKFEYSKDGRKVMEMPNAGGNSKISEALSVEYLATLYSGKDVKTEMEIEYWVEYKIIDFLMMIDRIRVGISVTRAMKYPDPNDFTEGDARKLLLKKLDGLIIARQCVNDNCTFDKSILHIWCQNIKIARIIKKVYKKMNGSLKSGIIVICTVADFYSIYFNRRTKDDKN